jgi:membrane-anchored protein YejM (alkaline phosphatase superfamily)
MPGRAGLLRKVVYAVAVLMASVTLVMLYADFSIYKIFGFHLNGFVWNLVTTPGGIDSIVPHSSLLSGITGSAGMVYFSSAHAPRSISLQRSQQNGLHWDASFHSTGLLQVGQFTLAGIIFYQ